MCVHRPRRLDRCGGDFSTPRANGLQPRAAPVAVATDSALEADAVGASTSSWSAARDRRQLRTVRSNETRREIIGAKRIQRKPEHQWWQHVRDFQYSQAYCGARTRPPCQGLLVHRRCFDIPAAGFARAIRRTSARISRWMGGRPGRWLVTLCNASAVWPTFPRLQADLDTTPGLMHPSRDL